MLPKQIKRYCALDDTTKMVLKNAIQKFNLSGRAYDRILKLSRTIADLEEEKDIGIGHLASALNYTRFFEKNDENGWENGKN